MLLTFISIILQNINIYVKLYDRKLQLINTLNMLLDFNVVDIANSDSNWTLTVWSDQSNQKDNIDVSGLMSSSQPV